MFTYRYNKHNIIIDLQLLQRAQQYPSRSTRDVMLLKVD